MPKLSEEQIRQKLTEGRNYKRLYCKLKVKYDDLKIESKRLKQELADQKQHFESIAETQVASFI